jgi:ribonuclease HI
MSSIQIYTDGSCRKNPGPGGWAAIVIRNGVKTILQGKDDETTNNRMELQGPISALESIEEGVAADVHSDSAYVVNCFKQQWYRKWRCNGWKNSAGNEVENRDLWEKLLDLVDTRSITFVKVKGHADNELNNECDRLAGEAANYEDGAA